jgi:Tol biopolymer transport system component
METLGWSASGEQFVMAGRQAQGTWNAAIFSSRDGELIASIDTKKRITHARFQPDGKTLVLSGATGQGQRKQETWPAWGRLQTYTMEA